MFMGRDYERASYRREQLVVSKEQFAAAEKRRSAYFYPDLEAEMPAQTLLAPPREES
jgi:formate hydrogenlyase subunit 6/NADH:ubiquinone oxidoreductase subunit I